MLNLVWVMEVQDPEETTQNERFEEYWRALAPHRVKIFFVNVQNKIMNATGGYDLHNFPIVNVRGH